MAKYDWSKIRDDYEIKGMSYSQLSEKYGCSRGLISGRSKKYAWDKQKVEQAISNKVNAIKRLDEITEQNRTALGERSILVDAEVAERLRLEKLFATDAEYNQSAATEKLKAMEASREAELAHYDIHSRITAKNKETLLGKTPQTQVNIQNNVGSDADAIVERLRNKHS